MAQHLQENMHCCHLANSISSCDITTRLAFFPITSVYGSNIWISLCLWIKSVCLSFPSTWSHQSTYCGTCYGWACRVDVCNLYSEDSILLQNHFLCQSLVLHFVVRVTTNKRFTTYVWCAAICLVQQSCTQFVKYVEVYTIWYLIMPWFVVDVNCPNIVFIFQVHLSCARLTTRRMDLIRARLRRIDCII